MNGKQLGLLFVALVVLGGLGLLVQHSRNQSANTVTQGAGGKLLGDKFPVNDVTHISFKQGTNEVNLVKKDDLWRVRERNDYAANFAEISGLLLKAADLKVVESDPVGPSDLPGLRLAPAGQGTSSGVMLDLKDKDDKTLKSLLLGKPHTRKPAQKSPGGDNEGVPDGRYVMLTGDSKNVLLVGDPLSEAEPKPEIWLNKDFFKVDRTKSVSVSYPTATNSWKITREGETGTWTLLDPAPGEQPDTNKLMGLANPFTSPSFEDVMPPTAKPEDTGLDKPIVITVETFDDLTFTVKLGIKTGENYPLTMAVVASFPKERTPSADEKPEEKDKADKAWKDRQKLLDEKYKTANAFENWIYLVPAWSLDATLKDRKDLMAEKKDEPKPAEPGDITVEKKADTNAPPVPEPPTK